MNTLNLGIALSIASLACSSIDNDYGSRQTESHRDRGEGVVAERFDPRMDPDSLWARTSENAVSITRVGERQITIYGVDPDAAALLFVYVAGPEELGEVDRVLNSAAVSLGGMVIDVKGFGGPPPVPVGPGEPVDQRIAAAVIGAASQYHQTTAELVGQL